MYYDGQNIETETEQESNALIEAIKQIGEVRNVDNAQLYVDKYSFLIQRANSDDGISMTGMDEESYEVLFYLYLRCGGRIEDIVGYSDGWDLDLLNSKYREFWTNYT